MFTFGNWVFFIILIICAIMIALTVFGSAKNTKTGIITGIALALLVVGIIIATGWYNTNAAEGIRAVKDFKSNINNGLEREIVITAEDGREIFRYEGKIDIDNNHADNYIKFDDENGKRYLIYYGIQDTVTIIEK